jgi:hypothetical protein
VLFIPGVDAASASSGTALLGSDEVYLDSMYIALLAMECAYDRRPFSAVTSRLRRAQVQILRPGTHVPTAATISNYVRRIYEGASIDVARYLQVCSYLLVKYIHQLMLDRTFLEHYT